VHLGPDKFSVDVASSPAYSNPGNNWGLKVHMFLLVTIIFDMSVAYGPLSQINMYVELLYVEL